MLSERFRSTPAAVMAVLLLVSLGASCAREDEAAQATPRTNVRTAEVASAEPVTGPEAEVATAFVRAVNAGDYDTVRGLCSSASGEAMSEETFADALLRGRSMGFMDAVFWTDDYAVDAVDIDGQVASAAISLLGARPTPVSVVETDGEWRVDWGGAAEVRTAVAAQLDAITGRRMIYSPFSSTGAGWGQDMVGRLASPLFADAEAVEVTQSGAGAVVQVAGRGSLQAAVPVRKSQGGWEIDWGGARLVQDAGASGEQDAAGQGVTDVMADAQRRADASTCLSNLKQLGLAMMMYASDYDERFPPAESWSDALMPYIKNSAVFACPTDEGHEHSYAYNQALSGKSLAEVQRPAETVLLFESDAGEKSAADAGSSWPATPRHDGMTGVAYSDGHCKMMPARPEFGP